MTTSSARSRPVAHRATRHAKCHWFTGLLLATALLGAACSSQQAEPALTATDASASSASASTEQSNGDQSNASEDADGDADDPSAPASTGPEPASTVDPANASGPNETTDDPPASAAFVTSDDSTDTEPVDDDCPVQPGATTASSLERLAEAVAQDGKPDLAEQLTDLAVAFDAGQPSSEELVQAINVLPQIMTWLAESASSECNQAVQAAMTRFAGSSNAGAAPSSPAAGPLDDEDTAAFLERHFDLSADDAACVADELDDGVAIADVDEVSFLVAMSTCANSR